VTKLTVLMPVLNSAEHLHSSIRSILKQTFQDFQFLIIDDGSQDGGQDIVRSFRDSRIRLVQNESNLGVAATLNKGLSLSATDYIARMDADDVSKTFRLASQVELMEKESDLDICGSWVRTIDVGGRGHVIRYPTESSTIHSYLLFNNPLAHPAIMLRKSSMTHHGLSYDERIGAGQDYEFWSRCAQFCRIKNIPKVLLLWRRHSQGVTNRDLQKSDNTALLVQKRELLRLGLDCGEKILKQHQNIGRGSGMESNQELAEALSWLNTLIKLNRKKKHYNEKGLLQASAMVWFRLCMNSKVSNGHVFKTYLSAPFCSYYRPCAIEVAVFVYHHLATLFLKNQRL